MRKLVFFMLLVLSAVKVVIAQDVSFKAIAPEAVVMGQQFQLAFTVNAEAKDLRIQEIPDFEILFGPSQSSAFSTQFLNGKSTSETTFTFTYILMPKKEGTFNIPPASVKVKNANYTSNALVIKVLPEDKAGEAAKTQGQSATSGLASDELFVQMQVSKRSVYEQEGFLVSVKLYSINGVEQLGNVKFPEFEGFLVQDIEMQNVQASLENYNNRNYRTYLLKQAVLYPQRSGKLTIEGGRIDAQVRIRTQQRARSIFDDLFDGTQAVTKTLTINPVTIDVKPLPSGKPVSFSGAVGEFSMSSSLTPTSLKTNEAVTLNLKISGSGNIKLIKNPEVTFPNDFELYDPKPTIDTKTTTAGVSGSKTIEYMAIPRFAGDFEIPAVNFSYFDPKSGTYKTLSTESYKLHVEKGEGGEGGAGPVVSNFSSKENVQYLGQDIRYLKVKEAHFVSNGEIFFGSFTYILAYLVPAILFIVFFLIYRKQVKENANIALVRTKKANKAAIRRLKNAAKLMKENQKEAFYEEILRALWGYLSDKLNIPQANLTKDNVEAELTMYGISDTLIREFMDILNTCEFARYAPSQVGETMEKLYELTADAIDKMENTIKK